MQDEERLEPDAKAAEAFEAMVKHYRDLAGVEVKGTMQIEMEQDGTTATGEEIEARIVRVGKGAGLIELRGFTSTFKDSAVWIVHESTDHSYYTESFEDSPYWLLFNRFQDLPFPHLAILWGDEDMDFVWAELHSRSTMLVPTKIEDVTNDEGAKERLITLSSPHASLVLHQNPKTKLIDAAEHEITGGIYVRDGAIIRSMYEFEHTVYENAGEAPEITFQPAGRQRVDFIAALVDRPPPTVAGAGAIGEMPQPRQDPGAALEGKPAPVFDLPLLAGGSVELEKLKGQVVVLDFWATWCPPCREALPRLHEVGKWARNEELPVHVYAVNCWEEGDANEAKMKIVDNFWQGHKYTLPVAMDLDDSVVTAYLVTGIPTTVVIRSDGVVHSYHVGAPPNYFEWLKGEITDALHELEGDGRDEGDEHGHAH
jgi:thiol-disulfide isomerase/thioredoxin